MTNTPEGRVAWRSPSNIAIVKYWGKHGEQLPANPSLSLTLSEAFSDTYVKYGPTEKGPQVKFMFEGSEHRAFSERIEKYVIRMARELPVLGSLHLEIGSRNSFPHSAGIASSASGLSALALCLCTIQARHDGREHDAAFRRRVSHCARLGSGSACRSIYGTSALWGKTDLLKDSSDEYAVPVTGISPVFETYHDTILIIDTSEKQVKSSAGHALMEGHPYARQRFKRAEQQLNRLLRAMTSGDVDTFTAIAEAEALDLHAMMLTSTPSFTLMRPKTLAAIEMVREFRADTGIPVCFTLDAGPNVHLLYPDAHANAVNELIDGHLVELCADGRVIRDKVGSGPTDLIK